MKRLRCGYCISREDQGASRVAQHSGVLRLLNRSNQDDKEKKALFI